MPATLPYLPSYNKVDQLFKKIADAKVPEAFTHNFLHQTLGLKSTGDRPLIPLLRTLGFIDAAGKPTTAYSALKNPARAGHAIADAVRSAYAPLYEANEKAHELGQEQLRGLVAQVAGTDGDMTTKVVGTFKALTRLATFDGKAPAAAEPEAVVPVVVEPVKPALEAPAVGKTSLRPEFHYNIQVHLPSNATEETYLSIFNALRRAFS
jgi:hypothetical protein